MGGGASPWTSTVAVVFMLLVLYSAEKNRAGSAERRGGREPGGELAEPPA